MSAAASDGLAPAVLTFDPHPASWSPRSALPRLLTSLAERCSMLARGRESSTS